MSRLEDIAGLSSRRLMDDLPRHPEAARGVAGAAGGSAPGSGRGDVVLELLDGTGLVSAAAMAWVDRHARAALAFLGGRGEVRVRFVADAEMSAAHVEFCDVEGTTDVLTFDMSEPGPDGAAVLDVDILACVDEASRQGARRGHATERELLLYIVHGVLHCLGHDDHDESAAGAMHAAEDRVLAAIGVGAVYGVPERAGGGA